VKSIPRAGRPSLLVTAVGVSIAMGGTCSPVSAVVRRQETCCVSRGLEIAESFRLGLPDRRFSPDEFWRTLDPVLNTPRVRSRIIGHSVQNRLIRAVTFGTGPTRVLLWSQMHGNESTATMALADVINFFSHADGDTLRSTLERTLTITMIPMLNPDGANRFRRENAVGIDVNRDARRLATPEAQTLKSVRDSIRPQFGFNLHDQNARTLVGRTGLQVAIALLAPAAEESRAYGRTRQVARLVAARIATALRAEIPGRVAKYDDTFNPRAFGDLMQQWGTSTVLIESGALPDDPQKQRLRALNVVALLTALHAIGTGDYQNADTAVYEQLPFNYRVPNDLLIRGGTIVVNDGQTVPADLALTYDDPVAETGLRLRDAGDLAGEVALDTLDATGLFVFPIGPSDDGAVAPGDPVSLTLRRGTNRDSEVVLHIGRDH
jgi:Zinc carboxypeptidase